LGQRIDFFAAIDATNCPAGLLRCARPGEIRLSSRMRLDLIRPPVSSGQITGKSWRDPGRLDQATPSHRMGVRL